MHENQHGFRTGRGTDSAISQLANYVERFLLKDEACLAVFLDIQAAFDSIKPEHIKEMLLRYGVEPDLVDWYYHLLTHRDLSITLHSETQEISIGTCLLYTSPSPRDRQKSRMPSSA